MANTFKNAFSENVGTSATAVLTCPSGNSSRCVLIGIQLTNTTSSEITATITLTDSSASNDIVMVNAVALPANTMLTVLEGEKSFLKRVMCLRYTAIQPMPVMLLLVIYYLIQREIPKRKNPCCW